MKKTLSLIITVMTFLSCSKSESNLIEESIYKVWDLDYTVVYSYNGIKTIKKNTDRLMYAVYDQYLHISGVQPFVYGSSIQNSDGDNTISEKWSLWISQDNKSINIKNATLSYSFDVIKLSSDKLIIKDKEALYGILNEYHFKLFR